MEIKAFLAALVMGLDRNSLLSTVETGEQEKWPGKKCYPVSPASVLAGAEGIVVLL
jgi:hypothetical protein